MTGKASTTAATTEPADPVESTPAAPKASTTAATTEPADPVESTPAAPKVGALVKLSDTGGYAIVVGENLVCKLGPAEAHELETEPVE